jgi:predicted ATPase
VLAGLSDATWARAYAVRLDEDRAAAAEEMVEARLAAGQHAMVVRDLEGLTQAHPYRDRLWAARMRALYRSGRQVEALRVYQVLDNCEHLLDACSELVDALLARCPHLHMLATSREALGVDGERAFRVPSLRIDTEATSLFVDRARAARPSLRLDRESEVAIVEICRQLDGIPLAIELAAARAAHLSPAEILDRLSDRFRLLTGGRRRIQRQQTLSAALDWSHSLLNTDEQVLLRRLAVFKGSFSLEAAEQICHPEALELLGSLVAKSLVTLEEHEPTIRYRLLETVRLYAEDHLVASGEAEHLRAAHRDWFLHWIESRPVHELVAHGGGYQLTADAANLAAALEWSRKESRDDICARIASRMVGFWAGQLRLDEMAMWW